ncbi:SWI/SNF chromatin-remodeling complex subunit, partial [Coemansia biformis]
QIAVCAVKGTTETTTAAAVVTVAAPEASAEEAAVPDGAKTPCERGRDAEAPDVATTVAEGDADGPSDEPTDEPADKLVWMDDELRVVIRLDIIIGHIALRDQLEWDVAPLLRPLMGAEQRAELDQLAQHDGGRDGAEFAAKVNEWITGAQQSRSATPEHVARVLCAEKRLGGEFETAIAHAIREQLYAYVKSFILAGYAYRPQLTKLEPADSYGRMRSVRVDDVELASCVLPPVVSAIRDSAMSYTFTPLIAHVHTADAERLEKDADREVRRKRRQIRGGRGRSGGANGAGGAGALLAAAVPDRSVLRTNRTMIPLPIWFDDDLPPGTLSFVEVPGEGAHFLDNYDARAAFEVAELAVPGSASNGSLGVPFNPPSEGHGDGADALPSAAAAAARRGAAGSGQASHLLGRRHASSNAFLAGLDVALAASHRASVTAGSNSMLAAMGVGSPATPSTPATPQQLAREKLRNPTGRPRGRPSILEKSLRDAAAARAALLSAAGHTTFRPGAIPGQLEGRPLEELCARWRCMSCGLTPDRTPLIRRGPEGMHSLCDACGSVFSLTRRFRDVAMAEINANMANVCGPLRRPDLDGDYLPGPDGASDVADGMLQLLPQHATPAADSHALSSMHGDDDMDDMDDDDDGGADAVAGGPPLRLGNEPR